MEGTCGADSHHAEDTVSAEIFDLVIYRKALQLEDDTLLALKAEIEGSGGYMRETFDQCVARLQKQAVARHWD